VPIERLRRLRPSPDDAVIVAVVAPAGYGKTTTVLDWIAHADRNTVWLSLDRRHDDPVSMASGLARAILATSPDAVGLEEAVVAPAASIWSTLMPRLATALLEIPRLDLVFDDVHLLTASESLDIVDWLAMRVPSGSQLIVVGRSAAGLALPRWRVAGGLTELGPEQLRLTDAEAQAVLASRDRSWTPDRAAEINRQCEGWVSGLLMTAQSDGAEGSSPVGRSRIDFVSDYVRSEVISAMPPEEVDFLLETSVLHEISAPICDAVRERSDSGLLLERLADRNVFVIRQAEERYRYHELFREALLAQATRRDPAAIASLRARAAHWHAQAGDPVEAVRLAQESGDAALAAQLMERSILPLYNTGRGATVRGWLDWAESEAVARRHARLLHGGAIVMALSGETARADRWASMLDELAASAAAHGTSDTVEASVSLVDGFFCRSGADVALASARRAIELLPPDDIWHLAAVGVLGLCQLANGLDRDAIATYVEVTDPSHDHAPGVNVRAVCLTMLARADLEAQDFASARARLARALDIRSRAGISGQALHAVTDAVAARLAMAANGDTETARRHLAHAQTVRPLLTSALPLLSLVTRLELSRAHLALADASGARLLLREIGDVLHARPNLGAFEDEVKRLRTQVEDHLDIAVGPSALTMAELRLLPWLTTHLSFREIGDRLFLSPTTVKTQALSVYRKLGASSRSEAVQAAVRAGLMDPATLPGVLRDHPAGV